MRSAAEVPHRDPGCLSQFMADRADLMEGVKVETKTNRYCEMSRNHFDETAGGYESGVEGRIAAGLYESVLKKIDGSQFRSVLDVGCGPGTVLLRIAALDKGIDLAGVDLSPEMARLARERLGPRAEIRTCNVCAERLPYDDNSFDRIICMSTFHHFPNPEKALSEMHRVVKPEGGIIIADITSFFPVRQCWNLLYSVSRSVPVFKFGDYHMYSQNEFRRLLEACRLKSVGWERVPGIAPIYVSLVGFVANATPSKGTSTGGPQGSGTRSPEAELRLGGTEP